MTIQTHEHRYGITAPYTIPQVFLPANTENFQTRPLPDSMLYKVARLNNRFREVLRSCRDSCYPYQQ